MPRLVAPDRPLVIVKLGGSLITRKREVEKLRPKILARLASEIAASEGARLILLHGAGSFGHPGARRFALARAPDTGTGPEERARGAAIVSAEVRRLHVAVLRALIDAGARPFSTPVAGSARNLEGALASLETASFESAIERETIPVAFGDVVPDDRWGFSILSADTIAVELASRLRPARVVFAADVPGILERGPGGRSTVVAEVTDETMRVLSRPDRRTDVTGGIRGKAAAMLAIARLGVDAGLISGLTDGALARAIRGEAVYGSWARARPAAAVRS